LTTRTDAQRSSQSADAAVWQHQGLPWRRSWARRWSCAIVCEVRPGGT